MSHGELTGTDPPSEERAELWLELLPHLLELFHQRPKLLSSTTVWVAEGPAGKAADLQSARTETQSWSESEHSILFNQLYSFDNRAGTTRRLL